MKIFIVKIISKLNNMAKNTDKKPYNGYNYSDGSKFESCYNGAYTSSNEPGDPVEVSFNEMYFGQTEGVRPTIIYKAQNGIAEPQPKPEPGPGPKPEPKMYHVSTKTDEGVKGMRPNDGDYEENTELTITIDFLEGYTISDLYIKEGGIERAVTTDFLNNGYYIFKVATDTQIAVISKK